MPTKTKVAPPKKESAKKTTGSPSAEKDTKHEAKADGKLEKKNSKGAEKAPLSEVEGELPAIDLDELEEQEDAAAAESSSQNGNAAALAAAAGNPTEMSASLQDFRHHPDMENFYRFIYENDLRHEALAIIDEIMVEKQQRRLIKGVKAQAH